MRICTDFVCCDEQLQQISQSLVFLLLTLEGESHEERSRGRIGDTIQLLEKQCHDMGLFGELDSSGVGFLRLVSPNSMYKRLTNLTYSEASSANCVEVR